MVNIFQVINNYINSHVDVTYGDLINENKNEVKQRHIKHLCDSDEYEMYEELAGKDRKRIIDENYHKLSDNYLMGGRQFKSVVTGISGISSQGELKQIC